MDDLLTEEEKLQMTESGAAFIEALEAFRNSQVKVDTEALELLLEDAAQLQESSFTEASWDALQTVVGRAEETLGSGSYSRDTLSALETELTQAMDQLVKVFTVQIHAGEGGTVTSDAANAVEEGSDVTFRITPDEGYELKCLIINGQAVQAENGVYVLENISANVEVTAEFQKIKEDPEPTVTPEPTDRPEPTDTPEPTDKPGTTGTPAPTNKPGTSVTPGGGNSEGSSSSGSAAQTGDNSPLAAAWLALGLGMAGAVVLIVGRKRSR